MPKRVYLNCSSTIFINSLHYHEIAGTYSSANSDSIFLENASISSYKTEFERKQALPFLKQENVLAVAKKDLDAITYYKSKKAKNRIETTQWLGVWTASLSVFPLLGSVFVKNKPTRRKIAVGSVSAIGLGAGLLVFPSYCIKGAWSKKKLQKKECGRLNKILLRQD